MRVVQRRASLALEPGIVKFVTSTASRQKVLPFQTVYRYSSQLVRTDFERMARAQPRHSFPVTNSNVKLIQYAKALYSVYSGCVPEFSPFSSVDGYQLGSRPELRWQAKDEAMNRWEYLQASALYVFFPDYILLCRYHYNMFCIWMRGHNQILRCKGIELSAHVVEMIHHFLQPPGLVKQVFGRAGFQSIYQNFMDTHFREIAWTCFHWPIVKHRDDDFIYQFWEISKKPALRLRLEDLQKTSSAYTPEQADEMFSSKAQKQALQAYNNLRNQLLIIQMSANNCLDK